MIDVADNNSIYYYHYDGLGSVTALSDSSGNIVEKYKYTVFGGPTILSPSDEPRATSDVNNPYMFTGRRYDKETGLYYYRFRYYKPEIGRFLNPDPIGYAGGLNLYTYVGNNPLNFVDPWGLCKEDLERLTEDFKDGVRDYLLKNPEGHISCEVWQDLIYNRMGLKSDFYMLDAVWHGWWFGPVLDSTWIGHNFVTVLDKNGNIVAIYDPWTPFTHLGFTDKWSIQYRSASRKWVYYPPFKRRQKPVRNRYLGRHAFDKPWFGHHF